MAITNNFVACMVTLSRQYCRVPSSAYFVCVWCRKLVNLLVDVEEWGQVTLVNMLTRYARTQFQVHRVIMVAILTCSRYLGFLYAFSHVTISISCFCFHLVAVLVLFSSGCHLGFLLSSGRHLVLFIFWPPS